ncbi:MAG: ABC transporter substrate-binding protein [Bacteroidia bacterium]
MNSFIKSLPLVIAILFNSCSSSQKNGQAHNLNTLSWNEMETEAKGKTVSMMMWQGDLLINKYMNTYVKPKVKELYGIELELLNGQGNQIVTTLMTELEASKSKSEIDLCWINGETFYQLRQIEALHGPWVKQLPNSKFIDFENPFIGYDFQQKTDGYECPWGNVQLAIIYNSDKVETPPKSLIEMKEWVKENPGVFTIETGFTGMTVLKSWLAEIGGGRDVLNGDFDEALYNELSSELWAILKEMKPFMWKEGSTFPNSVGQMHQLFANGELWFTMSNNDSEVDNKIAQGVFPESARAYVFEKGTIQNSHYLGIPAHSVNKAAAMVVANFMISPEAQLEKMNPEVWGDGSILSMKKLPKEWQEKFNNIKGRDYAPNREEISEKAIIEPVAEYMIRLSKDFRKYVIEN